MWTTSVAIGLLAALSALSLAGCSKELGRVPLSTQATGDTSVQLAPGNVQFWTDLNLIYFGKPSIFYQIELEQGGSTVASAVCDPLAPKPTEWLWREVRVGAYHRVSSLGRMPCNAVVPKAGATTVRVTLAYDRVLRNVAVTKADLIVKQ
ncbi:MAG: hypothetical protein ABW061_22070 [Polyangiaceae bacterium]